MSHNHSHGCCCSHGDDVCEAYSLYEKIDTLSLECLNERVDGSGVKVFKSWSNRLERLDYVESDYGAELLFNIPFTGDIKLKGIVVIADEELAKIRLFKSKMRMSFDDANAEADQEFEATHDSQGFIEYPVKATKFFNVHHLTMHFVNKNKEDDSRPCTIYYVGLKGEFTQVNRDGIVIANYELRPTENVANELSKSSREIQ